MVQTVHFSEVATLRKHAAKAIELGDLTTAYSTSKRILNILEGTEELPDELAGVLYELGLICTALDNHAEGTRHLKRARDFCIAKGSNDVWIVNETTRVLKDIEHGTYS